MTIQRILESPLALGPQKWELKVSMYVPKAYDFDWEIVRIDQELVVFFHTGSTKEPSKRCQPQKKFIPQVESLCIKWTWVNKHE